jgi:hypothetical protein
MKHTALTALALCLLFTSACKRNNEIAHNCPPADQWSIAGQLQDIGPGSLPGLRKVRVGFDINGVSLNHVATAWSAYVSAPGEPNNGSLVAFGQKTSYRLADKNTLGIIDVDPSTPIMVDIICTSKGDSGNFNTVTMGPFPDPANWKMTGTFVDIGPGDKPNTRKVRATLDLKYVADQPTATISGSATICDGRNKTISVELTGTNSWTVQYSDGSTEVVESNPFVSSSTEAEK